MNDVIERVKTTDATMAGAFRSRTTSITGLVRNNANVPVKATITRFVMASMFAKGSVKLSIASFLIFIGAALCYVGYTP